MRTDVVLTLTGPDRVGIVEQVTRALLDLGGNVETSRMARLGGEFAMLMLVSLPAAATDQLESAFGHLAAEGYKLTTSQTEPTYAQTHPGFSPYRIEVRGADHEGIIHEIARDLSERGINIESMETSTTRASMSGTPLFSMDALVVVPPAVLETHWQDALAEAAHQAGVDIVISDAERS